MEAKELEVPNTVVRQSDNITMENSSNPVVLNSERYK